MTPGKPNTSHGGQKPQFKPMMKSPVEVGNSQSQKPQSLSEHLDGALSYAFDSLFGSGNSTSGSSSPKQEDTTSETSTSTSTNPFAEALKKSQEQNKEKDDELKKVKHKALHEKMQMTEVFDLEKKKSEETIKQIKKQLNQLIKEMKKMSTNVDQSIHTAVFQGDDESGKYYETFFEKLLSFLVLLTKRVKEGNNWLQMFNSKKGKSKYQQNSKKYGSQYMFAQEGQGLTRQTG